MLSLEQLQNVLDGSWKIKPRPKPVVICVNYSQGRAEFPNEDYIVLTWDITEESNRQELSQIWNEIFPEETEMTFSEDQCSMIFAIDRQVSIRTHPPQFFYRSNRIRSMDELRMFKEEFDRNEKYFESRFFQNIVCCQDLAVMLCEYLPLNDVISTFTVDILQELNYRRKKLFIEYRINEIIPNNVVSIRIKAGEWRKTFESSKNVVFPSVQTLIIEDFSKRQQFSSCSIKTCFPILNYLIFDSVSNRSIDMRRFSSLFSLFPPTVTHFKICGSTIRCSHNKHRPLFSIPTTFNEHIQSFQLNLFETSHSNDNQCLHYLENCIFNTLTDFIRIMQQIRYVQLTLPTNRIQPLTELKNYCPNLNKITVKSK